LFEGVLHRFALWVKDGLLWCDDNLRFHIKSAAPARHGTMLEKPSARANLFQSKSRLLQRPCAGSFWIWQQQA
jgi:hypothetical protein